MELDRIENNIGKLFSWLWLLFISLVAFIFVLAVAETGGDKFFTKPEGYVLIQIANMLGFFALVAFIIQGGIDFISGNSNIFWRGLKNALVSLGFLFMQYIVVLAYSVV